MWIRRIVTVPRGVKIALILAGVLAAFVVVLWKVPEQQVDAYPNLTEEQRAKQEDEYRRTLAQIVGGALLLLGGYFTYRQLGATERNVEIAREALKATQDANDRNAQIARETLKTTQDRQITELFAKAIEQLGSNTLELQLGGIYSLERIAREANPQDHWTVMEVLTAYVRERAPRRRDENEVEEDPALPRNEGLPSPTPQIQAILTVLGRRVQSYSGDRDALQDLRRLDLTGADLRGAYLHEADLRRCNFSQSDLSSANLNDADLSDAFLFDTILHRTYLYNARLHGCTLVSASLQEANLHSANLSMADLRWADLRAAEFLNTDLQGADLREANLSDAIDLTQAQIDQALGDRDTVLPNHLHHPVHWPEGNDAERE
jgi:uncharacterized protein YjbI with pentapeptide repeats